MFTRSAGVSEEVIHYIPHHPVIRGEAQSTKMRIVYYCSAKSDPQSPSLNDCPEVRPPLQAMIFDIMLRNRMHRYCVTGDIEKAFHQIKIGPEDRVAMRLLWFDNLEDRNIISYRFTRVIFGSSPSPYILAPVQCCRKTSANVKNSTQKLLLTYCKTLMLMISSQVVMIERNYLSSKRKLLKP